MIKKRKKKIIIILLVFLILIIISEILLFTLGNGKSNKVTFSDVSPKLLNSNCDSVQNIVDVKYIFFKFNYNKEKYYSFSLFNSHIFHENFIKKEIEMFKVLLIDDNGFCNEINGYLYNYIGKEHIQTYIVNEYLYPLFFDEESRFEFLYEKTQNGDCMEVLEILEEDTLVSFNRNLLSKLNHLQKFQIFDESISFTKSVKDYKCNNIYNSSSYYMGDIDLFIEMYNKDYFSIYNKHEILDGFLMKLNIPKDKRSNNWKKIKVEILFNDGSIVSSTLLLTI